MEFIENFYLLLSYTNADNIKAKYPHLKSVALFNCVAVALYFVIPSFLAKTIYTLIILGIDFCFIEIRGLIITFTPIIIWVLLFSTAKDIPMSWRRPIDVDTLYDLESKLGLISFNFYKNEHILLDLLAWLPYGIIHYIMPILVGVYLLFYYKPGYTSVYLFFFGIMSSTGVLTQLCWPTAPPWYYKKYNKTPATYEMHGDPAGLQRIDHLFHIDFYTTTFSGNPLPWGAWPSLHSAFAVYSALFLTFIYPKYGPLFFIYVIWIWWATMYLGHHYFVDLLGGLVYAFVCCLAAIIYLKIKKPYHKDYSELKSIMVYQSGCKSETFETITHNNNNNKIGTCINDSMNKMNDNDNNNNNNNNSNNNNNNNDNNNNIAILIDNNTKIGDGSTLVEASTIENDTEKRNSMITQFYNNESQVAPYINGSTLDKLNTISNVNKSYTMDQPSSMIENDITNAKIIYNF